MCSVESQAVLGLLFFSPSVATLRRGTPDPTWLSGPARRPARASAGPGPVLNWIFVGLLTLLSLLLVLFCSPALSFRIRCLHPPQEIKDIMIDYGRLLFRALDFFLMMLVLLSRSLPVSPLLPCLRALLNVLIQSILTSLWICVVTTSCVSVYNWSTVLPLLRLRICLPNRLVLVYFLCIWLALCSLRTSLLCGWFRLRPLVDP